MINDEKEKLNQEKKGKYQKIFNLLPEAVLLINKDLIILDLNKKMTEWFNLKKSNIKGKNLLELNLFDQNTKNLFLENIKKFKPDEKTTPFEGILRSDYNIQFYCLITLIPFLTKQKNLLYIISISDLTQIKAAEKAFFESEEKFKIVSENSADIIYLLRYDTMKYEYLNAAFSKITGYTLEEINKIGFRNIIKQIEAFNSETEEELKQKRVTGNINDFNADYLIEDKNGNLKWLRDHSSPWYNSSGQLIGSIGIMTDITHRKSLEEDHRKYIEELAISRDMLEQHAYEMVELNLKLEESEEKLRELNASKDRFFSIIAHDLRSPFTTLIGFTEIIREDFDSFTTDELKDSINTIYTTSRKIYNLLENLLSWARMQTGKMPFEPQKVDLSEIILGVISLFETNAKTKEIYLSSNLQPNLFVYADKNMLDTVIRNLVSNALKFTPTGKSITVTSKMLDNFAEVSVIDTGLGMSKETVSKLFKIDQHVTTLGTTGEKGSGLGLILCKELVEKNGGKIGVESELEVGSRFYFSIPLFVE